MKGSCYIEMDLNVLEDNYKHFAQFGKVYFPVKTNHNAIILDKLKKCGSGFEVDSIEHMKKVLDDNTKSKIIYSNVAKSEEEIIWALENGVTFFTIDDGKTLNKILDNAIKLNIEKLKFNVRLNVFDIFKKQFIKKGVEDSRLGSSVKTCKELLLRIKEEKRIKVFAGLSFYVQVEMHDKENMLMVMAKYLTKHFDKSDNISWLNIGGGSRIKSLQKYYFSLKNAISTIGIKEVILEPGRYMVDKVSNAYVSPTRVVHKDSFGGEMVVSLGLGLYHGLIDIKLHKRKFDIVLLHNDLEVKLKEMDYIKRIIKKSYANSDTRDLRENKRLVLRGPTADSIDIIGIYEMPHVNISESDTFCIKNIGAYMEVLISSFSGSIQVEYKKK